MMQIPFIHILKVIFVLSTIVAVTDCCSSRILLLREHTLKIVQHQHDYHMHEHAHELQQKIEETAVQMLSQLELQRHQLEASAQDAAEELRQDADADTNTETNPNSDPDKDQLYAEPVEEATEAGNLAQEAEIFGSSTATWLTAFSPSSSSSETATMSTTVATTDTGDSPPPNPLDLSTPRPEDDKGTNRTNETEVQMLPCSEEYKASFCLNGGHCFRHPMVNNTVFHSCICVNDYDGERCAYKSWNGDYVYTPPTLHRKVRMAQIVFSFPVLIMLSSLYVLFAAVFMLRNVPDYNRRKQQHLHNQRFFVRC
ncbi:hypothetical protein KR054_003354 [Drosophila jambulina]|nr:hypothetical protein KR054_003354 [Drosophila jambulina]